MKIVALEPVLIKVTERGDWLFILVHTDEGITGLGEASHSLSDALAVHVLNLLEPKLAGHDPFHIEALCSSLIRKDAGRVERTVQSAIEQALWDIMGQALGVPIRALFGGPRRDRIRLYANINRHTRERSPEGFARAASQAAEEGFTAIKLAPFDELVAPDHVRTGPNAAWRRGVERVRAVRQAIGWDVELMIDCHGRMETSEAIIVARELEDVNLFWYEEPVPHTLPEELARITATISTPTASAESVYGVEGFAPFLMGPVVDVIMPDVKHDGGLAETKKIAGAAEMRKLLVAPHNPAGPVSSAGSAQVVSTIPNFMILEFAWGEVPWRAELLEPAERIEDGYLVLPDGPGLGHRLNDQVVAQHRLGEASSRDSTKVNPSS